MKEKMSMKTIFCDVSSAGTQYLLTIYTKYTNTLTAIMEYK